MLFIIQPAIPQYRVPFFEKININFKTEIYSCEKDFLNVETKCNLNNIIKLPGFISLKGGFFWCKRLPFNVFSKNDIVVIAGNPRVINYMLLFFYLKLKKIKIVWWGQGWTSGSRGVFARFRRWLMLNADLVILYTEKEASEFDYLDNVVGLNNGIDISNIPFVDCQYSYLKNDNVLNLLFIGRLTSKTKLDLLFKSLSSTTRMIKMHIIGTGEYESELKSISTQMNNKNVEFIWHGAIYDELDISNIAQKCHAFVYPGSVGLSIIHAFAHGLPAIVHDSEVYHMPEYAAFKENINGISYQYGDTLSLAKLLDEVTLDQLLSMRLNCRKTVTDTFNTDDMAIRFTSAIRSIK